MTDAPAAFITSLRESDKIEAVIPSVGFDDLLDITIPLNLPHLDRLFVVTSHADAKTVSVCKKYGATVVQTDLFESEGRTFAKGAGMNVGFSNLRFRGWRLALDADIVLPPTFRHVLLNYSALDPQCLYGADRADVIQSEWDNWKDVVTQPQWGEREEMRIDLPIRGRVITRLYGYLPLGYFQLWHASNHHEYPSTAGGAGLDDVVFSQQWPEQYRRLLPSAIVYHLCANPPVLGENWDGVRRHARVDKEAV